jgi:hypothetical protein
MTLNMILKAIVAWWRGPRGGAGYYRIAVLLMLCLTAQAGPTVTLTWDAPATNTDGSACTVTAYRVGLTTALAYTNWIVITNLAAIPLTAGTNTVRATAIAGTESDWSEPWTTNYVTKPSNPGKPRVR